MVLGARNDQTWIYVPAGAQSRISWGQSAAIVAGQFPFATIELQYYTYVSSWANELTITPPDAASTVEVIAWGAQTFGYWVRVSSVSYRNTNNQPPGNITLQVGWTTGNTLAAPNGTLTALFPIGLPPEFNNSTLPYASTRANAVAALFSNVSAVLNKEGTIRATRLPATAFNMFADWSANPMFTSSHPAETYFGPLEKGMYTFTLADGASTPFHDCRLDTLGGTAIPLFPISGFEYVNCVLFSDLDAGTGTNLALTIDSHLEFRTNSALFQLGYSTVALEAYHLAQVALVGRGLFYENPTHMAVIGSLLRAAVAKVAPVAKTLAITAGQAVGSKLLSMARDKVGRMTQSLPVQTKSSVPQVVVRRRVVVGKRKGGKKKKR